MEEENIKAYGYKNYITLKSKKRNKKNRRNRSEKKLKGTNSYKCCSFCCPKFSIRCENKRQISYVINYENDDYNLYDEYNL